MTRTNDTDNGQHAERSAHVSAAYGSTVLEYSAESVWAEIRDFNSYPAYIDGVTESYLEDDKRGDEVGCVRRFVYNGNAIRQTLTGHSDSGRWFTHAGCDPLDWPFEGENVGPVEYTNFVGVKPVTDKNRAFVEWSLEFKGADPDDLRQWTRYFETSIPVWLESLRNYLERRSKRVAAKGAAQE